MEDLIVHFGRLTYRDFAGSLQPLADLVSEYGGLGTTTLSLFDIEIPASFGDCRTARGSTGTSDSYTTTRAKLERSTRARTPWTLFLLYRNPLCLALAGAISSSIGGRQHQSVYSSGCLTCRGVPIDCGSLQLMFSRDRLSGFGVSKLLLEHLSAIRSTEAQLMDSRCHSFSLGAVCRRDLRVLICLVSSIWG